MKRIRIIFELDGKAYVVGPDEGARRAHYITLADGAILPDGAQGVPPQGIPAYSILRAWPIAGATAEWAETEDEFLGRVVAKSIPPAATAMQTVDESAIPVDHTFRDAWRVRVGGIEHDMGVCREIQRNKLREMRKPLMRELDISFMRACEIGDTEAQAAIALQKQTLRDVTADPRLDAAATPEELKLVIPEALQQALAV